MQEPSRNRDQENSQSLASQAEVSDFQPNFEQNFPQNAVNANHQELIGSGRVEPFNVRIDSATGGLGSSNRVVDQDDQSEQSQNQCLSTTKNIAKSAAVRSGELLIATIAGGFAGAICGAPGVGAAAGCVGSTCEKTIKGAMSWKQRVAEQAPAGQEMQR